MFDNIGRKVKTLATVSCIIGIVASIILGLMLFSIHVIYGLIVAMLGSFISWLSSLALYAIGQSAENSDKILKILQKVSIDSLNKNDNPKTEITTSIENNSNIHKINESEEAKTILENLNIDDIRALNIPFTPSRVFKNVISTASNIRNNEDIRSCIESSLEILVIAYEIKYMSLLLKLNETEIRDIIKALNDKIN